MHSEIGSFTGNAPTPVERGRGVSFHRKVGDYAARKGHYDPSGIALNGYWMIRTWNLNLFFFHPLFSLWNSSDF